MEENSQIQNDEINLIEMVKIVWDGKWKIAVVTIISFIAMFSYQSVQKNNFTAITEIQTIPTSEYNKYIAMNYLVQFYNINNINNIDNKIKIIENVKFTEITKSQLLNLYIEAIRDESVIKEAIKKSNLLDVNQYENEEKYNNAVVRLAETVNILSEKDNYSLTFSYSDISKWKNALIYINEIANKHVKTTLRYQFDNLILFIKKKHKFEIEDISVKINNVLLDYDRETSDRISFLTEQSAIAKKLGIKKNTIEVQKFGDQNTVFSNIRTDFPLYLRGYEAIEYEIETIKNRLYTDPFVKGLFRLEKNKRAIEQNKIVERFETELQLSPLGNNSEFQAASTNISSTKFKFKDDKPMLIIAIFVGLIIGATYVIITSTIGSQKVSRKIN